MSYLLQDICGLIVATILTFALTIIPGALFAMVLKRFAPGPWRTEWLDWSPILGLVLIPLVNAITIRFLGVSTALIINLTLVMAAFILARNFIWKPNRIALIFMTGWWIYCAVFYVDFDVDGQLYQSLGIYDLVKHAAVIREIATQGLPMRDPFFYRAEPAGYYHYFYDTPALVFHLAKGLTDPRMAFVAAAFWCGACFPQFLFNLVRELGWQRTNDARLYALAAIASTIGGLDLLGVAFRAWLTGMWEPNAEWWDDEISFVPVAASWVPHHLTAIIASYIGILFLCRSFATTNPKTRWFLTASSGLAFAAAFGLSIWVAVGTAFIIAASFFPTTQRRVAPWLVALCVSGLIAVTMSAPQLADILGGRALDQSPIGFRLREPLHLYNVLLASLPKIAIVPVVLVLTPILWVLEFGTFAFGALIFFKQFDAGEASDLSRFMVKGAVTALALNLFVQSTVISNDFGWRVVWFAAIPAMVWTICAVQNGVANKVWRGILLVLVAMGLFATLYNLAGARLVREPAIKSSTPWLNAHPDTDFALRSAYNWANQHLSDGAVLQRNPASAPRILDFGLYSHHLIGVADTQSILFGASRAEVARRLQTMNAVFKGDLPPNAAAREGVTHLVVTKEDNLWQAAGNRCIFRNSAVCILPVQDK